MLNTDRECHKMPKCLNLFTIISRSNGGRIYPQETNQNGNSSEQLTIDNTKVYLLADYLAQNYNNTDAQALINKLNKDISKAELEQAKTFGKQWGFDAKYRTLGVAVEPPFEW